MYDLPPQDIEDLKAPASHYEHFIAFADEATTEMSTDHSGVVASEPVAEDTAKADGATSETPAVETLPAEPAPVDPMFKKAEDLKALFNDGFQWKDLGAITSSVLDFVLENQSLGAEEVKANVMKVLFHLIDITDTPYLPDRFTDPLFKAMIEPFVELLQGVMAGNFVMLPTQDSEKPTGERMMEYIEKLKEAYKDGFDWSDLMLTIKSSVEFVGSFPYLDRKEKQKCVLDIINHVIDETDTPKVPDFFADGIFKSLAASFVEEIFNKLPQ